MKSGFFTPHEVKQGYFETEGTIKRPYMRATLHSPLIPNNSVRIEFLVDTGADRTVLSPSEGKRLREDYGIDLLSLPLGVPSRGVGGQMQTRLIDATLTMDGFSKGMTLPIFEPSPSMHFPSWMPSLLGRDVIYEFALHISERRNRVLFLDADEEDALDLP